MRIFLSLSLSSLLAIAVHAQASSDGNSASSVTASPPLTAPIDDIPPGSFGPHGTFHFLSPSLQYYPPDGTWKTNMLSASVAGESSGNTSVSISTVASGVTWRFSNASVTLLVNGSKPETFNGTTELAASNATVRGLAYGWYNFTLQLNGTGTFSSVEPIFNGSRW